MELCSIASGSSGNCICVGSDDCHVLIDAGISGKRIENGLNSMDLKTADMQGILITHEHIDHIAGLGVIARRYGIPMYATGGTVDAVAKLVEKVGAEVVALDFAIELTELRGRDKLEGYEIMSLVQYDV